MLSTDRNLSNIVSDPGVPSPLRVLLFSCELDADVGANDLDIEFGVVGADGDLTAPFLSEGYADDADLVF